MSFGQAEKSWLIDDLFTISMHLRFQEGALAIRHTDQRGEVGSWEVKRLGGLASKCHRLWCSRCKAVTHQLPEWLSLMPSSMF